jgi:hypothetical protein
MLSLAWGWFVSFFEKLLKEKSYKTIILLLISLFLINTLFLNNKVSTLTANVDSLKCQIPRLNSTSEQKIYSYINKVNYDAIVLFQGYARNNAEDLQIIIDNTAVTAEQGKLLKRLVEKTSTDIIQEVKKVQFRSRYLRPDSLQIDVRKVSQVDTVNQIIYARY